MTDVATPEAPASAPHAEQEAPVARTQQIDWRKVGATSGVGGAFVLAALGFFQTQFADLRDSVDGLAQSVQSVSERVAAMEAAQRRDSRELEIRLERLEEWRRIIPDGTGTDRWTGGHMVEWSLLFARENPALKVPDVRSIQRAGR